MEFSKNSGKKYSEHVKDELKFEAERAHRDSGYSNETQNTENPGGLYRDQPPTYSRYVRPQTWNQNCISQNIPIILAKYQMKFYTQKL